MTTNTPSQEHLRYATSLRLTLAKLAKQDPEAELALDHCADLLVVESAARKSDWRGFSAAVARAEAYLALFS